MIPLADLKAQYHSIKEEIDRAISNVLESSQFILGDEVAAFEAEFAAYCGAAYGIGLNSGTSALHLALLAAGAGPGDEVITVPFTFVATVAAIIYTGARPVFVDIDPDTGNLSVPAVEAYLRDGHFKAPNGPRAIVPVHLYGLPAALIELREIARAQGLKLVEDACQAHGARISDGGRWLAAGTVGDAGCFSFYPGKNLGAWGEGGAVATNDDGIGDAIQNLRDHGRMSHYAHRAYGYNARLDTLQAAVLRAKLERLGDWNARRRQIAAYYREQLQHAGIEFLKEPEGVESCYHLFVIRSPKRDLIRNALIEAGIECGIHYPLPLHLQPACRDLGYCTGDFPAAEALADSALSLPMHPHLTAHEVRFVCRTVELAAARA